MGLMERIGRGIRASLNRLTGQAENPEKILEQAVENPEKILEQAIIDMQEDLVQLRQAVARSIATQKRTEQQYNKNKSEANTWQQRAQLALQEGDENQAQEAFQGKKAVAKMAQALQAQLAEQCEIVNKLKKGLVTLESKISEAKTKKDLYTATACSAQASEKINQMLGNLNTVFERIDRLQELEARSEAIAESSSRERIGRVIHINLNRLIGQVEDPEKILEQAIIDMQEDLVQLRQAVDQLIATQKRTEQQYNKNQSEANNWQQRAQLALQKGDENLAREALQRKKAVAKMAQALQAQLAEQREIVTKLKEYMLTVESKVSEAKTKKDLYTARARSVQASE